MIPVEFRGFSFKGLVSYLGSDKEKTADNKDKRRLIYIANMANFKPKNAHEASQIMAFYTKGTTRQGLMKAAGVKGWANPVNTDKPPVLHLVFSPPEGLELDIKNIQSFVKSALFRLGSHDGRTLADHQYIVFLHQDTDHWHVHVALNLVDHRTGRLADPYRTKQKLQSWANGWCLENGFNVCPARQKKYGHIGKIKMESAGAGKRYLAKFSYVNLNGHKYHIYQQRKARNIPAQQQTNPLISEKITDLRRISSLNYQRRRNEKDALYKKYQSERKKVMEKYRDSLKLAITLQPQSGFFSLDRRQLKVRRRFFKREKTWGGILSNAWCLAWEKREIGFWGKVFRYCFNKDLRRLDLYRSQYNARRKLPRVQKIIKKRHDNLALIDNIYAQKRSELSTRHHLELAEERKDWAALNDFRHRVQKRQSGLDKYGAYQGGQSSAKTYRPEYNYDNTLGEAAPVKPVFDLIR